MRKIKQVVKALVSRRHRFKSISSKSVPILKVKNEKVLVEIKSIVEQIQKLQDLIEIIARELARQSRFRNQ
jgi:tetrahydromethanopterin S-methyltransferase subunit B